jgi:hypothetical protein
MQLERQVIAAGRYAVLMSLIGSGRDDLVVPPQTRGHDLIDVLAQDVDDGVAVAAESI